jgi:hypothetical protein
MFVTWVKKNLEGNVVFVKLTCTSPENLKVYEHMHTPQPYEVNLLRTATTSTYPIPIPTQLEQNSCTQNSQHTVQTTECTVHNTETHVHKIPNVLVFLYGAWT